MRVGHWLLVVSMALFVSSIGFLVVSARTAQRPNATEAAPVMKPVANVKQIMQGIVNPAATAVFEAVSTTVSFKGVEEKAPRTDAEWEAVGASAAALVESGNLLMLGSRAVDADWIKMSQALADASVVALKAIEAKNAEGLLAAGEGIYDACTVCHQKYLRTGG
jgi:hypothetical protein